MGVIRICNTIDTDPSFYATVALGRHIGGL